MGFVSLLVFLPFIGGTLIGVAYLAHLKGFKISQKIFSLLAIWAPLASAYLGAKLFLAVYNDPASAITVKVFQWIEVGDFTINLSFYVDSLSALMTLFVTFIAALIHIYSIGYMNKDEGFAKFFAYMNLFLGSMLMLVLADNPILMFMGWEGVGACSYLLIAFYYKDKANVKAGNKAFIINRIGDFGFVVGMLTLYVVVGKYGFDFASLKANAFLIPEYTIWFITLFLFVGAAGKSAQIPLYTWLPDAMAGPTPVSALIHAATMVTAGVYMVARFSFLYAEVPAVGELIAYVGAFTALVAAIIATKQTDIKKILAYSTMSQLGYMFIAVGIGAYSTGIFHVFTHAFFKALLFLGAGAVIYALHHEQNIFKMNNLKSLKIVYFPMLIATLAIAGIPPFAGFFSKDEILLNTFASGHFLIYAMALITAGLTSYYMFRLFFLTFHNREKSHAHIEQPPLIMTSILVILSVGSVFAGFAGLPEIFGGSNFIKSFLSHSLVYKAEFAHVSHSLEYILMALAIGISLAGIFVAYKRFFRYKEQSELKENALVVAIKNKFFVDEMYERAFVVPLVNTSRFIYGYLDRVIIYKIVQNSAVALNRVSHFYGRVFQNGDVKWYLVYMLGAIAAIAIYLEGLINV